MNKINSHAGRPIFKLAIASLIALGCAPVPALASTVTPFLDSIVSFGAQNEARGPFDLPIGTGLTTASSQLFNVFSRNATSGVFRQLGSSATLGSRSLFARSIITNQGIDLGVAATLGAGTLLAQSIVANQGINLGVAARAPCDGTNSRDCVDSYVGKSAADALTPVPVPAALWLFASGVLGVIGLLRRRSSAAV